MSDDKPIVSQASIDEVGWVSERQRIADQPPPRPGEGDMWGVVIADMHERRATGIKRYGTPLQANNGRDALMDAYAEALDLTVYLRQAIFERDGK